jgi:hypothetical protein
MELTLTAQAVKRIFDHMLLSLLNKRLLPSHQYNTLSHRVESQVPFTNFPFIEKQDGKSFYHSPHVTLVILTQHSFFSLKNTDYMQERTTSQDISLQLGGDSHK